ncbi:MAG: hypothetical protein ACRDHP_11475 [Ktedonobacterales bacterium]
MTLAAWQAREHEGGSRGAVEIPLAELERYADIFQAPDAAEFALFDRAASVADARTFPI